MALLSPGEPVYRSGIIGVVAVIASLLFPMAVLLIEIRRSVRRGEDDRAGSGDRDTRNLDYAYYATHWAILVGLIVGVYLLAQERLWAVIPSQIAVASNWIGIALTAHFAMIVLECLRRLRRCYEVFGRGNR